MMDGISAMDTGNNGQMLQHEHRVDRRSEDPHAGLSGRIRPVERAADHRGHQERHRTNSADAAYDIETNSDWNENTWVNEKNGDAKPKTKTKTLGYAIGGPIGKPGGNNKLFFFYAHEYRPATAAINNGNPIRIRVPTALERAGDFSQTRDNNGALFNLIKDPNSTSACTATNTAGCFQAGGVLGRIPADRLYSTGIALLNRYPLPNVTQATGTNYNYEVGGADDSTNLTQQPALRVDYQLSPNLRFTGKYSGQRARKSDHAGHDRGVQRCPEPLSVHHELRRDRELHDELVDVHRGHLRIHPQPAGWRRVDRRHRHGRHPGQRLVEPAQQPAGLPAALSERRRGRRALLRLRGA